MFGRQTPYLKTNNMRKEKRQICQDDKIKDSAVSKCAVCWKTAGQDT